jgi:hypothetical protein
MNTKSAVKPPCPIPKCDRGRHSHHAMCGQHWSLVPKHLQDKIYATAKDHAWVSWQKHLREACLIVVEKQA